jgi:hypothetical protein
VAIDLIFLGWQQKTWWPRATDHHWKKRSRRTPRKRAAKRSPDLIPCELLVEA